MIDPPHTIWWHVYPLGACGAPIRPSEANREHWAEHRLARLEGWLDYVSDLGCNGLLLGPVFTSTSHGYDTLDHFRLDPRLGDDQDWAHFVTTVHDKGLQIMLDGVFNHLGASHELVDGALAGNGMVRIEEGRPRSWEGHDDLAELDHGDPRVADLVVEVMRHWLDRGADGWRLDVAYAIPPQFWAEVLGCVRATHPRAFFLGEVIHGDYGKIATDGTLDAVTAYEVWKAIWSSISDHNMWELAWALERHDGFCRETCMQTFIGNHDVARITTTVGDAGAGLAAAILFTLPGMPSVYYGDEQGFRGAKKEGFAADDEIRPELPDGPDQLHPGGWWLYRLHQGLIGLRRRNPWLFDARIEIRDKTNTTLSYAVRGQGHELVAQLDVTDRYRVRIDVDGTQELDWAE